MASELTFWYSKKGAATDSWSLLVPPGPSAGKAAPLPATYKTSKMKQKAHHDFPNGRLPTSTLLLSGQHPKDSSCAIINNKKKLIYQWTDRSSSRFLYSTCSVFLFTVVVPMSLTLTERSINGSKCRILAWSQGKISSNQLPDEQRTLLTFL